MCARPLSPRHAQPDWMGGGLVSRQMMQAPPLAAIFFRRVQACGWRSGLGGRNDKLDLFQEIARGKSPRLRDGWPWEAQAAGTRRPPARCCGGAFENQLCTRRAFQSFQNERLGDPPGRGWVIARNLFATGLPQCRSWSKPPVLRKAGGAHVHGRLPTQRSRTKLGELCARSPHHEGDARSCRRGRLGMD